MKINEIYKCPICGNIVQVTHVGGGTLVCCGKPMELLEEKSSNEGMEKHLPVATFENDTLKVNVGSIDHPMVEEQYIEWIECIVNGNVTRKYLFPNDKPYAEFSIKEEKGIKVRAYCNVHGLWAVTL